VSEGWAEKYTRKWNTRRRTQVAALFRHHVDTPCNRRAGRSCAIIRQPCWFCLQEEIETIALALAEDPEYIPAALRNGQFHHQTYRRPFYGVWVCYSHHRMVEHGSIEVPLEATRDYLPAVRPHLRPYHAGARNPASLAKQARRAMQIESAG
jgi:hypothetical protein